MTSCRLSQVISEHRTDSNLFRLNVSHLNLCSNQQQKIPIMGVSGAGKSTLLNVLATICQQKTGDVNWQLCTGQQFNWTHKKPLSNKQVVELRSHHFGFLFQDSTLSPYLTIEENLLYPQRLAGIKKNAAKDRITTLISQFLPEFINNPRELTARYPAQVSGGQRQRVALMQALVNNPTVLFADEPAASLDWRTRNDIMQVLFNWVNEDSDRLFIWVTHHYDDPKLAGVERYLEVSVPLDNETKEKSGQVQWT